LYVEKFFEFEISALLYTFKVKKFIVMMYVWCTCALHFYIITNVYVIIRYKFHVIIYFKSSLWSFSVFKCYEFYVILIRLMRLYMS